MFVSQM